MARLFSLVRDLEKAKRGMPAATLARRNEIPLRSVYRDLHALEKAGFPIAHDTGARWKFKDGWQSAIPFPMPVGELLALEIARRLMRPLRGSPAARAFESLCKRLIGDRSSGSPQGDLFPRYRSILAVRSQLAIDYSDHAAVLETLCLACEQRRTATVIYFVESRDELTRREVDPYSLYHDPQLEAVYVFAWCHLRRAMRTFAVHRFRQAALTEERFEVPGEFSPEKYLRGAFRLWREDNATNVVIRLRPGTTWVSERTWHASQRKRNLHEGGAELAFTLDGVRELTRFVLQLGPSAEVIKPLWFRRQIASLHAEAARISSRAPRDSVSPGDKVRAKRARRGERRGDLKEAEALKRRIEIR